MKYLVAVSGGVDSVVLLHMLVAAAKHELIVAHFDHGIRPDSAEDARFVEGLAKYYQLPFYSQREELGVLAGEDEARKRRYAFLTSLAVQHNASIVTAHHSDDIVETVAINVYRGTGWRGLAVMGNTNIVRPIADMTKQDIYNYALKYHLEWVEDSTNHSPQYLRNRLRSSVSRLTSQTRREILELWAAQCQLKTLITQEAHQLLGDQKRYSRYFFIVIDIDTATELLREIVLELTGRALLREQLERGVMAIKTMTPRAIVQLGEGVELYFEKQSFIARQREKML